MPSGGKKRWDNFVKNGNNLISGCFKGTNDDAFLRMPQLLLSLVDRGEKTGVKTVTCKELKDLVAEENPETVEGLDAGLVAEETSPVHASFLNNIFSGRTQRQRVLKDGEPTPQVSGGKLYGQDFEVLRQKCLKSGKLFVDPDFPPDAQSMNFSTNPPADIEWKRPGDLVQKPVMFHEGATRFDINQGELGDCWLLAALSNLAMNKKLLHRVVPEDQSFTKDYAGIFHFRFWQYGEWVEVVIDDFLPTRNGKLIFMSSDTEDEFWTALLEKAYAKIHGSYEALKGGTTSEAMVDFTGGCTELYSLSEEERPKDLLAMMLKGYQRHSMAGCSLEPDPNVLEAKTSSGLVKGHAYAVTKVVKVDLNTPTAKGPFPLVRIRNPWGNEEEWKGAFSDGSPEWKAIGDEAKKELGLNFEADGEFWMSFMDFTKNFDQLEICNLTPDALDDEEDGSGLKWQVKTFNGSWVNGVSAGGCRNFIDTFATNPQLFITVKDPDDDDDDNLCTVIISLMQKGRRAMKKEGVDTLTIGFAVYYVINPEVQSKSLDTEFFRHNRAVGTSKSFINQREVSSRFRLPPGTYCIVPSTFNPGEEGDFILRVFTEKAPDTKPL